MFRLLLSIALIHILGSCSLGGSPAPQDHFYRLPEITLSPQQSIYKEIVIKPVKSSGLYHERAILFIESQHPLEIKRYHYRFWSATPAELIHSGLYQGLLSSGIASQISREISTLRPDFIIDSRIIHFERLIESQQVTIEVALDVSVRRGDSSAVLLKASRYHASRILKTRDMHASAVAFGEALQEISEHLVKDLREYR